MTTATEFGLDFAMPVLAKAPGPDIAAVYYANLASTTQLNAVPATNESIRITISSQAVAEQQRVFAFAYGFLGHLPSQPNRFVLRLAPLVVSWLRDNLPEGNSAPELMIYEGIDSASVKPSMLPWVKEFKPEVLRAGTHASASLSIDDLADIYIDAFLNGDTTVLVDGGTPIGSLLLNDAGLYELTVSCSYSGLPVSPVVPLREMPTYIDPIWSGHPLADTLESVDAPIEIYAAFEIYNESSHQFQALPAGFDVDLVDDETDATLSTTTTDTAGRVHFSFAGLPDLKSKAGILDSDTANLFFLVHTDEASVAGHAELPEEWSTKRWRATNGMAGLIENFNTSTWGTASSPVVFRIGVDFHVRLCVSKNGAATKPVAPGIPVRAFRRSPDGGVDTSVGPWLSTDQNGCVEGFFFDIDAGDTVYFAIEFTIENTAIHLPKASVKAFLALDAPTWGYLGTDAANRIVSIERTSIGTHDTPWDLLSAEKMTNVGFYVMTVLTEWSTFLHVLTAGAWPGVVGLAINLGAPFPTSLSWPIGSVNLVANDFWDRSSMIHELSHQIVWTSINFGAWSIAINYLLLNMHTNHHALLWANPEHAIAEGWPEFMAHVFEPDLQITFLPIDRQIFYDGIQTSLGPPLSNTGESVEGALAGGLADVFWEYVVGGFHARSIPESVNGNIRTDLEWLADTAIPPRFKEMIWNPLLSLKNKTPNATELIDAMRQSSHFVEVLDALHEYNMAYPTITSIVPASGSFQGGQLVTISGTRFDAAPVQVTFDGTPASSVTVIDSTKIQVQTPPGTLGKVILEVNTALGPSRAVYEYVL